jgi:hypothetical protein
VRLASPRFSLPLPDGFVDSSHDGVSSASSDAEAQEIVVSVAPLGAGAPVAWMLAELVRARQAALQNELQTAAFAPLTLEPLPGRVVRAFVARGMPLVFCALVADEAPRPAGVVVTLSLYQYTRQTPGLLASFLERAGALLGALSLEG